MLESGKAFEFFFLFFNFFPLFSSFSFLPLPPLRCFPLLNPLTPLLLLFRFLPLPQHQNHHPTPQTKNRYGFNPGSQQAISGATNFLAVANAAVTTTLAPAASGLSALVIGAIESKIATGKAMYGVENMGNGCLAGLAAITASCNVVRPWAAIVIGAVAGALYLLASKISVKIKLDDPLDAVAVHAWNGLWGIIAAGLFSDVTLVGNSYATNDPAGVPFPRGGGLFYSGGPGRGRQLAAQVVYAIWVAGWVLANMVRLFLLSFWFLERKRERGERSNPSTKNSAHSPPLEKKNVEKKQQVPFWLILKVTGLLRVPSDEEIVGLDHSYHGGSAYPGGPEEAEDKSLKGPVPTSRDLAAIKSELAELKASVAKSSA